jgi:hypothetical protein
LGRGASQIPLMHSFELHWPLSAHGRPFIRGSSQIPLMHNFEMHCPLAVQTIPLVQTPTLQPALTETVEPGLF